MTRREPVPLGDALGELSEQLGMPSLGAYDALVEMWPAVVGADVAQHARVRSVHDGECTIEVDGPAWATRVKYLGPELRRRVNERCGAEVVARVTVVVNHPRRAV